MTVKIIPFPSSLLVVPSVHCWSFPCSITVGSDCLPCKIEREKVMSVYYQDCYVFINIYIGIKRIHKSGTVNENENQPNVDGYFW